ncbi:class I SAM-dependent methyltransferase [Arthrobacter sp. 35W]|uniref:class I SAM-dependent methyltransferase n=1 Tax=Arthrobacter sp. 35W TaxID=1132441 RepID=UPI00041B4E60|nr:methyltransferase [Arthrobacter sp. 35W]
MSRSEQTGPTPDAEAPAAFDFSALRRFPDVEADNLFAWDPTDELILDSTAARLADPAAWPIAVVGDRYGALALATAARYGRNAGELRVHQDVRSGELALAANAEALGLAGSYTSMPLDAALFEGVRTVLWQLPRNLEELAEVADLIARYAHEDVRLVAGGRVKHMTAAQNTVLAESFGTVQASLAAKKSRLLTASGPLRPSEPSRFPAREFNDELGLWLCAHGATFAGTKLDIGTRFLLTFVEKMKPGAATAIDLGCGSGVIAAYVAANRPELTVVATDQSAAAVASAAATAAANGLAEQMTAVQDDALAGFAPGSAELVVLNPPFHVGGAVHAGAALKLFDAAARVLKPGGELWTVYNHHLDYRAQLERRIGPTWIQGKNPKFTVALSVRSA